MELRVNLDAIMDEMYAWIKDFSKPINDTVLCFYPKEDSKFLKIWFFLDGAYFKNVNIACPINIFKQNPCEQKFVNVNRKMDVILIFDIPDDYTDEEDIFYLQLKYGE